MNNVNLGNMSIRIAFTEEDLQDIRARAIEVPNFWTGHLYPPQVGDLVRFGGKQYGIVGRVWEQTGPLPELVLYMGDGHTQTDKSMH